MSKEKKLNAENVDCENNCCKSNKKLLFWGAILFVVIFVFCVGVAIGGYILVSDDKEEIKNESFGIELFDEKSKAYTDIKLTDDNFDKFISLGDYNSDEIFRTTFLEGNDFYLDDLKMFYVIYAHCNLMSGTYYASLDFLNSEIEKVFSTGLSDKFDGYGNGVFYSAEISYICHDSVCTIKSIPGGGSGYSHPETHIFNSRKSDGNTIYTIKEYYNDWEDGIFVKVDGELLCEHESCPEDIVGTYGDKLVTYEMTFDKDNRYVSSKKIN